jgi:hypothetical protein
MEEHKNDPDNQLYFTEVLENLILFFVIKSQVKKEMLNQGINIDSDEEEGLKNTENFKEQSQRRQSIMTEKMSHLEEGLNQKDAQLVKQLKLAKSKSSNANVSMML